MSDISNEPIKKFLDAVDIVLNSNTFLLSYISSKSDEISHALANFLNSEDFKAQITEQDIEREWYNMYFFDNQSETYKVKEGILVKHDVQLKISTPSVDKKEYLMAMLTVDNRVDSFVSPYRTYKTKAESIEIVDNFINSLFPDDTWNLFSIYPDFLYSAVDIHETLENIRYFEGNDGCDTATLLVSDNRHYLLLTNGIH